MKGDQSHPARMSVSFAASAHITVLIVLLVLSVREILDLPTNVCSARKEAHQHLISALDYAEDPHILQRASSKYLRIAWLPESRNCRPLSIPYSLIESVSARSPLQNVLLYITSVTGATKKAFIEIDSSRAHGQLFGGKVFTQNGWSGIVMHERWSAYEACRAHYEQVQKSLSGTEARIEVIDAGAISDIERFNSLLHTADGAGILDVMMIFAGGGRDINLLSGIHSSAARPRILALFYQAYWGMMDRSRIGDGDTDEGGRERLFTGASLPALVRMAAKVRYRLIWCLRNEPIAIFIREEEGHGIRTRSPNSCMALSAEWKRDAEAMWDLAQRYDWT
ncbi:hypothetical protein FGB62_142g044 [Gracilaria domingensis]|nr:hypothetical protein FGB62_142g044 [Gracilaria domingensis]